MNASAVHPHDSAAVADELEARTARLDAWLRAQGSVLVAYSGGVDSAYLAAAAHVALGSRMLAAIADSPSLPRRDLAAALELARERGWPCRRVPLCELDNPDYAANPPDRCFHCKQELFGALAGLARAEGYAVVVDGSNADDAGDYRPGRRAAERRGVRSPLQELGFTKADIRAASRRLGLPTADRPAAACLASRFPYGERITAEGLGRVERAEDGLRDLGFVTVRVRAHGEVGRVELAPAEIAHALDAETRARIVAVLRAAGFRYAALDLQGYRTGSLNEGLIPAP